MHAEDDTTSDRALVTPSPPPPLLGNKTAERPVVWKLPGHSPPSQALTLTSAHLDPTTATTTTATGPETKSFFGRIRVVVRCRPLQRDTEGDHTDNRVQVYNDEVLVCEKNNPSAARSYRFDRVLSSEADQARTFAEVAPLVDHVLDGFHATVFAYGQTGSGKTYTMDGLQYVSSRQKGSVAMVPDPDGTPVEQHGIMPRIIQLLFDRARARQRAVGAEDSNGPDRDDGVEYTFRCSYYQIYNEKITDLLRNTSASPDPNGNDATSAEDAGHSQQQQRRRGAGVKRRFDDGGLRVRWQKGDVFKVENLFVCSCASPDEMREMLFTGIQQKVVSSHLMNYQSSRSHCVFTIYVECRARRNGELQSCSELSLVDLAGSEKIGLLSSNPSAKLVKESIDINTSLLALGKVIMALSSNNSGANGKAKRRAGGPLSHASGRSRKPMYGTSAMSSGASTAHIPYRDSKLTMLLKHALGGNSLTTMIACISPSDRYVEETTSTLLYAGRAKNIRNAPRVNEDATTALIRQLREEIAQLKAELGYYREMAAKSLVQQESATAAAAVVCSHCGAGLEAVGSERASPSSRSRDTGMETTVTAREADQLADSLIAACDMLKNMMQVNAELRDSYDAVRDVQEEAERREANLNAENLALRERLAVLESIVLQDDDDGLNDAAEDDEEEERRTRNERQQQQETNDATRAAIAAAREATQAAEAIRRGRSRDNRPSTETPRAATIAASPPPPPPSSSALASPLPEKKTVVFGSPPAPPGVGAVRARPVGASTSKEELPPVVSDVTTRSPAFGVAPPQPVAAAPPKKSSSTCTTTSAATSAIEKASPTMSVSQKRKRKSLKKKKHRVLARRLKEYEQHYRAPSTSQSYEEYYQQPQQQPPPRKSRAAVGPATLNVRAMEPEVAQSTAALEDMKVTVAKLPKNVVPEYVPDSLLRPGMFGSLAFGGRPEERTEFEQNRNDRAARLRALQQRQQELYQQVHQAVRRTTMTTTTVSAEHADASEATPQHDEAGTPKISSMTRRSSEREAGVRGSSNKDVGGRRTSLELFSPYGAAPPRQQTAAYQDSRTAKKAKSSTQSVDSMARLMEYLKKEQQ